MGHTTVLITTGWIKRAEVYFQCHFHIVASFCIMYIHLRSEFAHYFSLPKIALRFSEIRRHLKHCSSVLVFACIYISCLNMMVDTLVWCSQVTYYVTKAKERKELWFLTERKERFFFYPMPLCNSVQGRGPWLLQFNCTFFVLCYTWRGNMFSRLLFYLHYRHFLLCVPVSASCWPLSRHSAQIRQVRPEVFFMLFMCLYS